MTTGVLISCEHATCRLPPRFREAFRGASAALRSHRGCDLGALDLARYLARRLGLPLFAAPATRLLADPNRSLGHRQLLSTWSRRLPAGERELVLERYWRPHREAVERAVAEQLSRVRRVVHVSVHTFTPRLDGKTRRVDVALLYDPARKAERAVVDAWLTSLGSLAPDLLLRRNHPYRGNADGLTTHLRQRFRPARYLGLELEVSQRHPLGPVARWHRLRSEIETSLRDVLGSQS